ncbi:family 16 glycosylhydrolase, partial [Halalkalibacterium halodurans]
PGVGVDEWTGVFDGDNTPLHADYEWVRYTPLEALDEEESGDDNEEEPVEEVEEEPAEDEEVSVRPIGSAIYETFNTFNEDIWSIAHGWTNGQMFNATWYDSQITFSNGIMRFAIDKEDDEEAHPPYKAAELRTNDFYHYGLFEVSMKPAKVEGTVSSFFTYTGEWDWDGDPWDEIDIEFLGKDTTRIQFNYFTNGVGGNEFYYDLGFDASESFNTYAFEWREDSITWYVNGEAVHTATENIPQTPQKIMMNLWPGVGVDGWTGVFDGDNTPVYSYYDWVRYTPLSELSDPPVTPEPPIEEPTEEPIEEPIEKIEIDENDETKENENDLKESGGERLPNTATSMYHYLLFGLLAFAIGVMVYLRARVTEK